VCDGGWIARRLETMKDGDADDDERQRKRKGAEEQGQARIE
jgi:hypothetical protein